MTDLGTLLIKVGITGVSSVLHGMKQLSGQTHETAQALDKVASSSRKAEGGFSILKGALSVFGGNLLTGALSSGVGLLGNLASGAVGFGQKAMGMASNLESIKAAMTALTGSSEAAEAKMQFIRELAIPSKFTSSQLYGAGQELEAFGLRIEKVMPLVAKLGMAFSADTEHLEMLVRMFGRLQGGSMPEMEALTRFGLNKNQFKEAGVKFSKEGTLLSSPLEALNALEKIIESKYGGIFDQMQNTSEAGLSSLTDMWEQAMTRIGNVVLKYVMPYVSQLSKWIQWLLGSGWLDNILGKMGNLFNPDTSVLDKAMSWILAIAEKLPALFKLAGEWLGKALNYATAELSYLIKLVASGALADIANATWHENANAASNRTADTLFGGHWNPDQDPEAKAYRESAAKKLKIYDDMMAENKKKLGNVWGTGVANIGLAGRADQILALFQSQKATGTPGLPGDPNPYLGWGKVGESDQSSAKAVTGAIKETAANTREMVKELKDLKASVWGGGKRTKGALSSLEAEIAISRAYGLGIG